MTSNSGGASPTATTMSSNSPSSASAAAQPASPASSTLASTSSHETLSTASTPSLRATSPTLSDVSDATMRLSTASEASDATTTRSSSPDSSSSGDSVSTEELYIQAELLRNLHLELDDEQQLRAPSRPHRSTSGGPAPLHRPQAYPPLSSLPKVKLTNDPKIVAIERARGETQSSCYPLPFNDANSKQVLAVIPGHFLPGFLNSEEASPKPAVITQSIRLGQFSIWGGKGWARLQSLAGYGTDLRPMPICNAPNMTEAEAQEPGFSLQLHSMIYVPEWATEYPFALLYHPATGFAFPLIDFEDMSQQGKATFPYKNEYKARYVALWFCPFDPFDLRHDSPEAQDGHKHAGEHPWRTSKRIFSRA